MRPFLFCFLVIGLGSQELATAENFSSRTCPEFGLPAATSYPKADNQPGRRGTDKTFGKANRKARAECLGAHGLGMRSPLFAFSFSRTWKSMIKSLRKAIGPIQGNRTRMIQLTCLCVMTGIFFLMWGKHK